MDDLRSRHCSEKPKGSPALSAAAAEGLRSQLHPDWQRSEEGKALTRTLAFPDYHAVMEFVNALAWISHREDHHPDLSVHYAKVVVRYSTHSVGGLSDNDFICAAKLDALL